MTPFQLFRRHPDQQKATVTILAVVTILLGALALATPLSHTEYPESSVGSLLGLAAAIEVLHALRRSTSAGRRQGTTGAIISMVIALFLINAPLVASRALRVLIAGWFGVDAVRDTIAAFRASDARQRTIAALAALGNAAVAVFLLLVGGVVVTWGVAIAGALRIFGIAWTMMVAPVYTTAEADETVVDELGLADEPAAVAIAAEVEAGERARTPIDFSWTCSFVATLFAIHVGRMNIDRTLLGLLSPAVAVLGDMSVAIVVALLAINPVNMAWHGPTRWIERRLWRLHLTDLAAKRSGWRERLTDMWLRRRLTVAIRMRAARYSIPAALYRGLQSGLPFAAILAATVPVWGMSWYFDTENWAAGMWNSWAASRTDKWREAMIQAVTADGGSRFGAALFAVKPPGIDTGDFSFIVIGDTGEGDASQHVLRDQLLAVGGEPEVRFVVISSDVVYPTGSMTDYEAKFWLPFKGVARPIYAIPGNHDWYDALEAFNATFLDADAARTSIRARVEADLRVSSTTESRIESLITEAARLRGEYGVPTGFQRAPFFEVQTDRFSLIAIDTGVMRTIDDQESAWLDAALARSAGKTTMAVVGHPFYTGGHDATEGDEAFSHLKATLLSHGVTIMMAGDTHDLEYYSEPDNPTQYFVNGGGGAYLSFGTSLAWPTRIPTANWAYYPNRDDVTGKIEARTPWWKRPAWWWTRQLGAWPFTAEWLSAVFDYNVAPFFQSFMKITVERSTNRIRVIPYGIHGRLTWGELAVSDTLRQSGASGNTPAEWVVPMSSVAR